MRTRLIASSLTVLALTTGVALGALPSLSHINSDARTSNAPSVQSCDWQGDGCWRGSDYRRLLVTFAAPPRRDRPKRAHIQPGPWLGYDFGGY